MQGTAYCKTRQTLCSPIFAVSVVVAFERRELRNVPSAVKDQASRGVQRQPLHRCAAIRASGCELDPSIGSMRRRAEASRVLRRDDIRRMMARCSKSDVGGGMTPRKQHTSPEGLL